MSDDPQLEDVREWYIAGRRTHSPFASDAGLVERFDTWLTQHDREVAAGALRDAAGCFGENQMIREGDVKEWLFLRARADQIEKGK